ncbi:MAG: trypsin-like peptidase domain-containing protein [Caldilineaceae bacterium]|nr:trypsin-like peptidase domain-containing protein [Caldilineaceae bacterium]
MTTILQKLSGGLAAVSEQVWPSLVQVRNGDRGMGAGTIVRSDGLIVTNAHVVVGRNDRRHNRDGGATLSVRLMDGRAAVAEVEAIDAEHDLAALRTNLTDLIPIALRTGTALRAGSIVMALGFPWGVAGGATSGVVIDSLSHSFAPATNSPSQEWLAASLHLRPGHSGGPMVDSQGRLVGINTMMNGPDVGVAVPVHVVMRFLAGIEAMPREGELTYV